VKIKNTRGWLAGLLVLASSLAAGLVTAGPARASNPNPTYEWYVQEITCPDLRSTSGMRFQVTWEVSADRTQVRLRRLWAHQNTKADGGTVIGLQAFYGRYVPDPKDRTKKKIIFARYTQLPIWAPWQHPGDLKIMAAEMDPRIQVVKRWIPVKDRPAIDWRYSVYRREALTPGTVKSITTCTTDGLKHFS